MKKTYKNKNMINPTMKFGIYTGLWTTALQ